MSCATCVSSPQDRINWALKILALIAIIVCVWAILSYFLEEESAVFKPNVFVNFDDEQYDGSCFNGEPQFSVVGSIYQKEGIHMQSAEFGPNPEGEIGDCVQALDVPNRCPYNPDECPNGATISIWFYSDGIQPAPCGGTLYNVWGNNIALSKGTFEPNTMIINVNLNHYWSFCHLTPEETANMINKWTHFLFTITPEGPGNPPNLFIDGEPFNITEGRPRCFHGPRHVKDTEALAIGCRAVFNASITNTTTCSFVGKLDDFRVYDHVLDDKALELLGRQNSNIPPFKREACDNHDENDVDDDNN